MLRNPNATPTLTVTVVKLAQLNGREANILYQACDDPIEPPAELANAEQLVEWLLAPKSGVVQKCEFALPIAEAALLAILVKLVRHKRWNKDTQGHQWTKEDDLLGQAPVMQRSCPRLYALAGRILARAEGGLLLTKGANQGKTPKGWSINTAYLPAVKQAIIERSLAPLRAHVALADLMAFIDRQHTEGDLILVDSTIVSERVLAICRDR
jgi:hypothetical protein